MLQAFRKRLAQLIAPHNNSMSLPEAFRRYGNRSQALTPNWSEVIMSDEDMYTGYPYAAIKKRANAVARLAKENIKTQSAKKDFKHPYLQKISESPTFTDNDFWRKISTYLDLEGVFYLMAIRSYSDAGPTYGEIQEFKLLNPYHVRRILSKDKLKVEGYIETKYGNQRTIPPSMIIEIRDLNPFDEYEPYAMTDAAKDTQFTMKSSSDFTRHAITNNINAPGILTTDVILDDEQYENFKQSVRKHVKGEPIFGNGAAVKWDDMTIKLKDAALDVVDSVERDKLFAVAGMSKTLMGIEQSGTTRETAKVQKDLNIENEIIPRIETVLDALNQDYKNNYKDEYKSNQAIMTVTNPNATDHDADLKDTEVKQKRVDLYNNLLDAGYDPKISAQYVKGEIDVDMLGMPKPKVKVGLNPKDDPQGGTGAGGSKNSQHDINIDVTVQGSETNKDVNIDTDKETDNNILINQYEQQSASMARQQESFLQNAVTNIESKIAATIINNVRKITDKNPMNAINSFEEEIASELDIIKNADKKDFKNELELAIAAFYGVMITLQGGKHMRDQSGKFAMPGTFTLDKKTMAYIKTTAKKVSDSHVDTVVTDLYQEARSAALEGLGQPEIISRLRSKFSEDITTVRAKTVARSEANRAFTRSQYEADRQFIDQNDLSKKAYKKFRNRSGNPCDFCKALAAEPPIPFTQNFRSVGEHVEVEGQTLEISFESLSAGNAHPNCSCDYELVLM